MSRDELAALRPVAASMGIMLETTAERLAARGGPHWASPGQAPRAAARDDAARRRARDPVHERHPRRDRRDARRSGSTRCSRSGRLAHEHGHLREVIVQNFRAKPDTRMAEHPDASLEEHLWSVAVARIVLGPDVHVQAPPNLAYDDFPLLLDAGIDDWGGVSPVTVDHVNPEAPWPEVERLREACASARARAGAAPPALPRARRRPRPLGRPGGRARRSGAPPTRTASRARTAGLPASRARALRRRARPRTARARRRRARRGRARAALRGARGASASGSSRPPTGCGARSAATR